MELASCHLPDSWNFVATPRCLLNLYTTGVATVSNIDLEADHTETRLFLIFLSPSNLSTGLRWSDSSSCSLTPRNTPTLHYTLNRIMGEIQSWSEILSMLKMHAPLFLCPVYAYRALTQRDVTGHHIAINT